MEFLTDTLPIAQNEVKVWSSLRSNLPNAQNDVMYGAPYKQSPQRSE